MTLTQLVLAVLLLLAVGLFLRAVFGGGKMLGTFLDRRADPHDPGDKTDVAS